MSGADVLASASAVSSFHSTPWSRGLSAYSQDVSFEATVPVVDRYVRHDISGAKTIEMKVFLEGLGAKMREIEGNDEKVKALAQSQKVLDLRETFCQKVKNEMDRYGPFCDLANHIIGEIEKSNILFVRSDPRYIDGVYNSKRKPDVIAVPKDHKNVINGRWKEYNKSGPPRRDEKKGKEVESEDDGVKDEDEDVENEDEDVENENGGEKKAIKPFVSWGWDDVQIVAEFKRRLHEILFGGSFSNAGSTFNSENSGIPLSAHTLSTKRKPRGSKVKPRAGSAKNKGGISSSHLMMQSISSSTEASRSSGKRALLGEMESETSSRKRPKLEDTEMRTDLRVCGAKYAVDQLSALTNRRHVIECLITDGTLIMAYYDRAGPPIYSTELNFVEDLYQFTLLLKSLACMTAWQRGFLKDLRAVDATNSSICYNSSPSSLSEESKNQCLNSSDLGMGSSPLTHVSEERHIDWADARDGSIEDMSGRDGGGSLVYTESYIEEGQQKNLEEQSEIGPPPTPPIESQQLASDGGDREAETKSSEKGLSDAAEHQGGGTRVPVSDDADEQFKNRLGKHRYDLIVPKHTIRLHGPCGRRPPYGLVTSGSSVFFATCNTLDKDAPNRVYAVKISWPLKRRCAEDKILRAGREALQKLDADPELKRKYGNRKLEDSLPMVYLAKEIDDLKKMHSFRWRVMRKDKEFRKEFNKVNRVCRFIVMEYLVPLKMVTRVDDFKQAMRDLVLVHHFLFFCEKRILHRDVSVDNCMVRYYNDGSICGVLIDYDLAEMRSLPAEEHTASRSGTRPFMAWELLESNPPPIHLERYDWESFFYVICWIGCRFSDGEEVNSSVLKTWTNPDDEVLLSVKRDWLFQSVTLNFQTFYESVALDWAKHLQSMFSDGLNRRKDFLDARKAEMRGKPILDEEFDNDTLGGCVTWDRLWNILQN